MITKDEIIAFEKEIAQLYSEGKIHAPVHLRSGREEQLIDIFTRYDINDNDWVFGYWDSHELALLKDVPATTVKNSILAGNSIALCYPKFNILCSGIVGSLAGVAVGTAWALKKQNKPGRVFHFCGEMSAETGIFHEAVKYSTNWNLPIVFVVCDNGLSVMTKTREVWNHDEPWWFGEDYRYSTYIHYFKYTNGYPHSGLGKLIKF